jgi:hypothetical protein
MGKLKDTTIPDFDQHSHDPLCPLSGSTEWDDVIGCDDCNLIAKVREDQTQRCVAAVETLEPLLDIDKFKGGYDCCGCSTTSDVYIDSIDAMSALLVNDYVPEPASEDK